MMPMRQWFWQHSHLTTVLLRSLGSGPSPITFKNKMIQHEFPQNKLINMNLKFKEITWITIISFFEFWQTQNDPPITRIVIASKWFCDLVSFCINWVYHINSEHTNTYHYMLWKEVNTYQSSKAKNYRINNLHTNTVIP